MSIALRTWPRASDRAMHRKVKMVRYDVTSNARHYNYGIIVFLVCRQATSSQKQASQ
ncbi:MAG: hypothetical protein KME59_11575 [Trichormus sp. ATA11-4-KO1]|nr:hypothetical protein [Trichormus sp. ATA11-4-KO1]